VTQNEIKNSGEKKRKEIKKTGNNRCGLDFGLMTG
jgi:hypothetical protein